MDFHYLRLNGRHQSSLGQAEKRVVVGRNKRAYISIEIAFGPIQARNLAKP